MQWDERIGRRVKLRDLHIVLAVTQAGSMGKAAARLGVSQPVVSKALAGLEHTLGVRLFDRTKEGVEPTAYGRALLKCGTAVFDELRRGVKDLEFLADPTAGELRIGTTNAQAAGIVSAVVDRLSRRHPRVIFHVTEAEPLSLRHILSERQVELVLGALFEPNGDEEFDVEILFRERMVVLAGKNSRWSDRSRIALSELVDEPWVLGPDRLNRFHTTAFHASGLSPPEATVVSLSLTLRNSLLATGRYLTMLPGSMFLLGGKHLPLKVLPVKIAVPSWPIAILTVKNRTVSPVARLFIDCARDIASGLGERVESLPTVSATQGAR